jgi:hypothetical protein
MSELQPICLREIIDITDRKTKKDLPDKIVDAIEDSWSGVMPILGVDGWQHILICQITGCVSGCLLDQYADGSLLAHNAYSFGDADPVPEERCIKIQ